MLKGALHPLPKIGMFCALSQIKNHNIVLINNSRTAWPTQISYAIFEFLRQFASK